MGRIRAAIASAAVIALAAILVSGGSSTDPRTPAGPPGQAAPFLGTAVAGSGRLTAAIDAYGDLVDLRPGGPAEPAWTAVSSARQAAGSVATRTGIVARAGAGPGPPLPLWRASQVEQRYLRGSNVLRTRAAVGGARVVVLDAVPPPGTALFRIIDVAAPGRIASLAVSVDPGAGDPAACRPRPAAGRPGARLLRRRRRDHLRVRLSCAFRRPRPEPADPVARAVSADRRWLGRARALGKDAPAWARKMYARSLLALHALTGAGTGAVAAGAREGWAYVWPRDAGAVAIALARAGYRSDARRAVRFLRRLDLGAAARFRADGAPVEDARPPPGDAEGWVRAAAAAAGLPPRPAGRAGWRHRGDYGERSGERDDLIANAIAAGLPAPRLRDTFAHRGLLLRRAGDARSGVDSAVAWAVRPFARPALFGLVRRSLRRLTAGAGRFGLLPSERWPGAEPWTAPTAWVAWSLAALGERQRALALMGDLRRAATPAGALPERVDARSGVARSTTPLAWSHAFAILALQQLWPPR